MGHRVTFELFPVMRNERGGKGPWRAGIEEKIGRSWY